MKKIIISISIIGILGGCETEDILNKQTIDYNSEKQINYTTFNSCFDIPDTNHRQHVIGCSNTFFKLIKDKRVLSISTDSIIENGYCAYLTNDSLNEDFVAELEIFDSDIATLSNICSDLIIMDEWNPLKTRILKVNNGQILIGKTISINNNGNEKTLTTILVKDLNFIDALNGVLIEIEDELLWQVEDIGTPG